MIGDKRIKEHADEIRKKICGVSSIYGERFDKDNEDHLIVAVWGVALEEARDHYRKEVQ